MQKKNPKTALRLKAFYCFGILCKIGLGGSILPKPTFALILYYFAASGAVL